MAKGSNYERKICYQLSEWWTKGERSDIFWRSHASGGRATTRFRKGKQTVGQYGDITAVDPIGKPFTDLITLEIKKGYSKYSFMDLLDRTDNLALQQWEEWINQASRSAKQAGSYSWMILSQRNRRQAIVMMPIKLYHKLMGGVDIIRLKFHPRVFMDVNIRIRKGKHRLHQVCIMIWEDWIKMILPRFIKDVSKSEGRSKHG